MAASAGRVRDIAWGRPLGHGNVLSADSQALREARSLRLVLRFVGREFACARGWGRPAPAAEKARTRGEEEGPGA